MNSENESTSTFQRCSNFAKKHWRLLSFTVGIATALPSAGYWVGQSLARSELNGTITVLKTQSIQQENDIKSFSVENRQLKTNQKKAQELIAKKNTEIEELKNELSKDSGQAECCKNINAQISKIRKEKDDIDSTWIIAGKRKMSEREREKEKESLNDQIIDLQGQLKECKN